MPFPSPGDILTRGWNPSLLHLLNWQADSLPLNHLGNQRSHRECLSILYAHPATLTYTHSLLLLSSLTLPGSRRPASPALAPGRMSLPCPLTWMPPKQPLVSPSAGWNGSADPSRGQQSYNMEEVQVTTWRLKRIVQESQSTRHMYWIVV